jgi:SOS-response transcriptional repressor LexA
MRFDSEPPTMAVVMVHDFGEVGAGSVVPFIPRSELAPVVVPENLANSADRLGIVTVSGVSLEDLGIYTGDVLIIKHTFTWREITPDRVCIVYVHATGELVAKKVVRSANTLILRASGGGIRDLEYAPDEIEIRAIVVGHQRLADRITGAFRRPRSIYGAAVTRARSK